MPSSGSITRDQVVAVVPAVFVVVVVVAELERPGRVVVGCPRAVDLVGAEVVGFPEGADVVEVAPAHDVVARATPIATAPLRNLRRRACQGPRPSRTTRIVIPASPAMVTAGRVARRGGRGGLSPAGCTRPASRPRPTCVPAPGCAREPR